MWSLSAWALCYADEIIWTTLAEQLQTGFRWLLRQCWSLHNGRTLLLLVRPFGRSDTTPRRETTHRLGAWVFQGYLCHSCCGNLSALKALAARWSRNDAQKLTSEGKLTCPARDILGSMRARFGVRARCAV